MSTQIVEFNQFESDLAEYKSRYVGVVYDFSDKKQEKRARSDRLAIGKTVAELDRVHKAVKAPLQEQVALLDGERKRIKDGLLEVQDGIKSQIARHEAELQAIEDALEERVQAIRQLARQEGELTSALIVSRLDALGQIEVDESYSHRQADAVIAWEETEVELSRWLVEARRREAEAAEMARLKAELAAKEQAERDARIAREARAEEERKTMEAQVRAEAAEKAARDAEARAEQAKIEAARLAEENAKREAEAVRQAEIDKAAAVEQARLDAERRQREELEKVEAERVAREANKQHRVAINKTALAALMEHAGLDETHGKAVIIAIAEGRIPAVRIEY